MTTTWQYKLELPSIEVSQIPFWRGLTTLAAMGGNLPAHSRFRSTPSRFWFTKSRVMTSKDECDVLMDNLGR